MNLIINEDVEKQAQPPLVETDFPNDEFAEVLLRVGSASLREQGFMNANASAIKKINDFTLPDQKNIGTIDDKVQHLNYRIQLKKEGQEIIENLVLDSPVRQHQLQNKRKGVTRKDALAIQRQVKVSFRKYEKITKKQAKKFDIARPPKLTNLKERIPGLDKYAPSVQNSLLSTSRNLDSFQDWIKPMQITGDIIEKADMYEKEQKLKMERAEKLSNEQQFDNETSFSDKSEMISCSAMLEQNYYGNINKLMLQSELQSSVDMNTIDKKQQLINVNQKPGLKLFKGDDNHDENMIINVSELDQLDKQYKKNEYNAQKMHHHNIHTMDKFKDLLLGKKL